MSTHSRLSPSKRLRWSRCPGSVREEARYDDDRNEYAIDGTHSHTLLENCILQGRNPSTFIGTTLKDHDGEFTVDKGRADRVQIAFDYIVARKEEHHDRCAIVAEKKVDPSFFFERDDLKGTVDVWILGEGLLEIIDYKDGMGVVDVKDNLQMELYLFGVLSTLKSHPEGTVKRVRMTIIQPKLKVKGMNPITSHEISFQEFYTQDRIDKIKAEAAATDDPNAPLTPGEIQCKYCKHKGSCSALANQSMKEVGMLFSTTTTDVSQQGADKNPSDMTDGQIAEILEAAPLMREMLKGVEEEALRRFKSGKEIPGFKVVTGRGQRSWAFPDEEIAPKLTRMGIPKGSIYKSSLVSPAQVEKLTWSKKDGTKMQVSKKQLTMLSESIKKSVGSLTVVPESDDRPAVIMNAAPMFSAIVEVPQWLKGISL